MTMRGLSLGAGGRLNHAIGQKPINQDSIGQKVHREHQFVPLRRLAGTSGHQAGIEHGDIQPPTPVLERIAKLVHRFHVCEINLEHFHVVGAGQAFDLFACIRMAAPASHEDAPPALRQVDGHRLSQPAVGPGDQADLAVDADTFRHRGDRFPLRQAIDNCSGYGVVYPVVIPGSVAHRHHSPMCLAGPYRMPGMPAPSSGIRNARL